MSNISIIIADDHPVILHGVNELIEQSFNNACCVKVRSAASVIEQLEQQMPDLLITDYHMPDDNRFADGMQFISYLTRNYPKLNIIVFSIITNHMISSTLYDLGVKAVIYKQNPLKELLKAVHNVLNNQWYYPPGFHKKNHSDILSGLSPREFEVIRLFTQGLTISKISEHLNRSIKTVSAQKKAAIKKLKLNNDQELISFCTNNGLFQ